MAVRERLEYDVAVTGAREGERDLARVERAISGLTEQQTKNVRSSKAFAEAHEHATQKAITARRAELTLADARAKLDKITKTAGSTESQRARALLNVQQAELRAAKAARAASGAHADAGKAFRAAAAGAGDVERQSTRASRAVTAFGKASRGAGKVTGVGFAGVSKTVGGVRVGLGGLFKGVAIGIPVVGALTVGLGALAKGINDQAVQLDLMERKSRAVYGKSLPEIAKWSTTVAHRAGLTTREMVGLATSFADMLQPMGFTVARSAQLSTRFAQMAPILAEWSGGTMDTATASESLVGALTGEYDTLQRLGVPISDAAVQAELLKRGQKDLTGQALMQAKAVVALDLVYRGTTAAQKAYADGAGGIAAQQAETTARFKEARDAILKGLLPGLNQASKWVAEHTDDFIDWGFQAAAGVIRFGMAVGKAIGSVLIGVGDLLTGLGDLLEGSDETWQGILLGASMALSIINPSAGRAARGALAEFERLRAGASEKLGAAGERAKQMGKDLKESTQRGGDAALSKLEDVRRAALNIPKKTLTRLEVDERSAQAKVADIRRKLRDPELTKTRRAKLEADLRKWEAQLRQIKRDKELAARAVGVPTGLRGLPSRVVVSRITQNGVITGVQIGSVRSGRRAVATGGPIHGPGTKTSDSIPAMLSTGEHVITADEVTAAGGHGAVMAWRKSVLASRKRFAFGGPVVDMDMRRRRPQIASGMQAAAETGIRSAALSIIRDQLRREQTATGGPGMGWQAQMAALRRVFPGLALISGFRPGAITATGNRSYHASGRAVDIPPRMDVFNWLRATYPGSRELIFSPAGNRQLWNGRNHFYSEPTRGDHWDHVHWAMAGGGVIREPVVGRGLRTGASYSFGERGPETVVPGVGGVGDIHIHLPPGSVIAGSVDELARKLRPALRLGLERSGKYGTARGF